MKNFVASFGLAAAGLLVASPSTASAAFVNIGLFQPSGSQITVNDFEFGFNLNGGLFQQGLGNAQSTTLPGSSSFTFDGSWIDNGATSSSNRTIYFVNPSSPTSVLGVFTLAYGTDGFFQGNLSGSFDPNGIGTLPGGVSPSDVYLADGSTYDFSNAFITFQVTTPAPGAAAALGLAGAASLRRRRR